MIASMPSSRPIPMPNMSRSRGSTATTRWRRPSWSGPTTTPAREIAKGAVDTQPLYIAFPHGHNFHVATNWYTDHDYVTSAFGTLVEKRSPSMSGIYSAHHAKMATIHNTVVAASKGAQWCIVIHDNNAANVLEGQAGRRAVFHRGTAGRRNQGRQCEGKARRDRRAQASMAPRTAGNFIRFLLGRPMLLRK